MEARDVLVATDGYTTGVTPELQRRLIPVGSFIIATEPLEPETAAALLPKSRVAFDSKHFLHYFRVTSDRRLLFGGRAEFRQPDEHTAERIAGILRADMVRIFPELAIPASTTRGAATSPSRATRCRAQAASTGCTTPAATADTAWRWPLILASRSRAGWPANRSTIRLFDDRLRRAFRCITARRGSCRSSAPTTG